MTWRIVIVLCTLLTGTELRAQSQRLGIPPPDISFRAFKARLHSGSEPIMAPRDTWSTSDDYTDSNYYLDGHLGQLKFEVSRDDSMVWGLEWEMPEANRTTFANLFAFLNQRFGEPEDTDRWYDTTYYFVTDSESVYAKYSSYSDTSGTGAITVHIFANWNHSVPMNEPVKRIYSCRKGFSIEIPTAWVVDSCSDSALYDEIGGSSLDSSMGVGYGCETFELAQEPSAAEFDTLAKHWFDTIIHPPRPEVLCGGDEAYIPPPSPIFQPYHIGSWRGFTFNDFGHHSKYTTVRLWGIFVRGRHIFRMALLPGPTMLNLYKPFLFNVLRSVRFESR